MIWHGYAAARMNEFLSMVRDGTRDLTSPDLSPFYDNASAVSQEAVADRMDESVAYRTDHDLPPIGEEVFSFQISQGSSRDVFIDFVVDMGIEQEYTEDMYTEEIGAILLALEPLSRVVAALSTKGIEPDQEAVQQEFEDLGIPVESESILHLSEPLPNVYAEEDSIVAEKLRRARVYTDTLLEESP